MHIHVHVYTYICDVYIHANTLWRHHGNTLQHILSHCNTLQHRRAHARDARGAPRNTLQYTLSHYNTHCFLATHCNTGEHEHRTLEAHHATHCDTMQHTHCRIATHTVSLQHTATHCNTGEREHRSLEAQHKALWAATPPHPAPYCNTLQNTPTHEDALQHAAPAPDSAECMDVGARCRELHHVKSLICDADTKKEKEEALLDSRIMESVAATNPYGMCVCVCFWVLGLGFRGCFAR